MDYFSSLLMFEAWRWNGSPGVWRIDATLPRRRWSHYVVTYDHSSSENIPTMYVDGVPYALAVNGVPTGTAVDIATSNIYIGNIATANLGIVNTLDVCGYTIEF
jgi:hypothetical protein